MSELRSRRYVSELNEAEVALPAGDVTEGVVRIGNTVRRPHQPQSYAVAAYLDHLQLQRFAGAPRYLGRDASGRDVLSFLEGDVAGSPVEDRFLCDDLLASVARLVHALHEAASGYRPEAEPFPVRPATQEPIELVGHLDVTPQNVVVRDGVAFGLIDFDLAGETTRFRDSYNAAMHWVPLRAPEDLVGFAFTDQLRRLRLFADSYGWTVDQRRDLPRVGAAGASISWTRMKQRADEYGGGWARMWDEGVGDLIARRGRWLLDNEAAIVTALLG